MTLFDRLKNQVQQAGKGAQKLGRLGQLKLDLVAAETKLTDGYKQLGKATANRWIDRGEGALSPSEPGIREALDSITRARAEIAEIETEMNDVRGDATS